MLHLATYFNEMYIMDKRFNVYNSTHLWHNTIKETVMHV